MDNQIVQDKIVSLFNNRIKDINNFWGRLKEQEVLHLIGTSRLLDRDSVILERLVKQRIHNDNTLYNLYKHYENFPKKRNYYKNGLVQKNFIKQQENKSNLKRIAIFLPHITWNNKLNIIFNLGNLFTNRGYSIDYFIAYNSTGEKHSIKIGPTTCNVITYNKDEDLEIFSKNYDLAVATHWDLIFPLYFHFDKTIYLNLGNNDTFSNQKEKIELLKLFYSLPIYHLCVSNFVDQITKGKFQRKSWIIPCGVNIDKFKFENNVKKENYILIIGDEKDTNTNIVETITHLIPTAEKYNTYIRWVSPVLPSFYHDKVKIEVGPSESKIVEMMQKAKLYVHSSLIEPFSRFPLEAMSCGTPVVASNNIGILQYGCNKKNLLLFPPKNFDSMNKYISSIFESPEIEKGLIREGLETSKDYDESFINNMNFRLIQNEFLEHRFIKPF